MITRQTSTMVNLDGAVWPLAVIDVDGGHVRLSIRDGREVWHFDMDRNQAEALRTSIERALTAARAGDVA